jgi:hypothetical protein
MSDPLGTRPVGRPRKVPASPEAPAPEPALEASEDGGIEPEAEALALEALEDRAPLTPAVVHALNQTWRDVVQYDDEGSKTLARRIVARLRRAGHRELHPGCQRVTLDVPLLPNKVYVRINERAYFGTVEVWECTARTILELVHHARRVEAARMDDRRADGPSIDLDSPLAERARAIQRA